MNLNSIFYLIVLFCPQFLMGQHGALETLVCEGDFEIFQIWKSRETGQLANGRYTEELNGKRYRDITFSDGEIQSYANYDWMNQSLSDSFWLTGLADTFAIQTYYYDGRLTLKRIYYYDSTGRKRLLEECFFVNQVLEAPLITCYKRQYLFRTYEELVGYPEAWDSRLYDTEGYFCYPELTGVQEEYYQNGQVSYRYWGDFVPGKQWALEVHDPIPYMRYYENGQLKERGQFDQGPERLFGEVVEYYANGRVLARKNYQNGMLEGKQIAFDSIGNRILKQTYVEGNELLGTTWYSNGKKKSHLQIDETGIGRKQQWYENGQMASDEAWLWDKLDQNGESRYWHGNGKLKSSVNIAIGENERQTAAYFPSGKLKMRTTLKGEYYPSSQHFETWTENGVLVLDSLSLTEDTTYQKVQKWYVDGTKRCEIERFGLGESKSEYQFWYPNGQLHKHYFLKQDKLNGIYKSYYENGNPAISGNYFENIRDGEFVFYQPDGTVSFQNSYTKGKPENLPEMPMENIIPDSIVKLQFDRVVSNYCMSRTYDPQMDTTFLVFPYDSLLFLTRVSLGGWGKSGFKNPAINTLSELNYLVYIPPSPAWAHDLSSPQWEILKEEIGQIGIQIQDTFQIYSGHYYLMAKCASGLINLNQMNKWLDKRLPLARVLLPDYLQWFDMLSFIPRESAWEVDGLWDSIIRYSWFPSTNPDKNSRMYYADGTSESIWELIEVKYVE